MGLWIIPVAGKRGLCCLFRRYTRTLVIPLRDTLIRAPFTLLQDLLQMHLSRLNYSPVRATASFLFLTTPRRLSPGDSQPLRLHRLGYTSFTPHWTRWITMTNSITGILATHRSALTSSRTVSLVSTPTVQVTHQKLTRSRHSCGRMVWSFLYRLTYLSPHSLPCRT